MVRTQKSKVLAVILTLCMIISVISGFSVSTSALTGIELIRYNASNDITTTTAADLTAAGALRAIGANDAAYGSAVALATDSQVDTLGEIQTLVDDVNLAQAILVIKGMAGAANTATAAQLIAAGATAAISLNETQYQLAIQAKTADLLDTSSEIISLVASVNTSEKDAAIVTIKGFAAANNAGGLTENLLLKAGITGYVTANLDRYKAAIVALADDATLLDTQGEIQSLITNVNDTVAAEKAAAAINKIKLAAANDDASGVVEQDLIDAGLAAAIVKSAYISFYRTAIEIRTPADVDTAAELLVIVTDINTAKDNAAAAIANAITAIMGYAANNDATALTIAQLTTVGAAARLVNLGIHDPDGPGALTSTGYVKAIEDATSIAVDTALKIQNLIAGVNTTEKNAAVSAISTLVAAGTLTIDLLDKAEISISSATALNNAVSANLPSYKAVIIATATVDRDTTSEIQAIVTNANTALAAIEAFDAATVTGLTNAQLLQVGVSGSINDVAHMDAYKLSIGAAAVGGADSLAEIQGFVTVANAALALAANIQKIEDYTSGTVFAMEAVDLTNAGAVNVNIDNIAAYRTAVGDAAAGAANTTAKIQIIVDNVNAMVAAIIKISVYAANDDASTLTIAELVTAGISSTVLKAANLDAYKAKIAAATMSAADTTAEILVLINFVNDAKLEAAIAKIEAYNVANNAAALTIDELIATNVVYRTDNIEAYKVAIAAQAAGYFTAGGALSNANLQTVINNVDTVESDATFTIIKGYAANDNASGLTREQLVKAGVLESKIINLNMLAYKTKIAAKAPVDFETAGSNDISKLRAIIDQVNQEEADKAVTTIKGFATSDDASALTIDLLTIADNAQGIMINATPSINVALQANLAAYKTIIAAATSTEMDEIAEIRAAIVAGNNAVIRANAIAKIMSYAGNAAAMTLVELVAAGVTVIDANIDAYKAAITAKTSADLDTTAKIQAVLVAADKKVAAINKIENLIEADTLSIQDLLDAGVSASLLISNNLGKATIGYKAKLLAAAAGAANTTQKIQDIIIASNAAVVAAAVALIRDFAANDNASGLTSTALLIEAGIINTLEINLGVHDPDGAGVLTSTGYIQAIENAIAADADTTAEIQALINNVNNVLSTAAISGVNVGTVQGTVPAGSSDPTILPVVTVAIPTTVTAFLKSNITVTGSGVVSMFLAADFTGTIGDAGIAITANTTTIYVKVVSANGISTKYYKVVLNVVNPTAKYAISSTEFEAAGSNFVATVTLDRAQAATLANPKLLLIITLADGETQVFLTQNAFVGVNEIVVGAGVSSVSVVLVNGYVDWEAGNPVAKSAYVTLDIPTIA